MTRPLSLIDCECWDIGERLMIPKKFKNLLFFDPLFISTPGKAVAVYYNFTDPKQDLQPIINFLENNIDWLKKLKLQFDKDCNESRNLIGRKSKDYKKLIELNHNIWPIIAVAMALGSTEIYSVSKVLKDFFLLIREESDDALHPALEYINKLVTAKYSKQVSQNILLTELLKDNVPTKEVIKLRKKGWTYHKGSIISDPDSYISDNNIQLIEPTKDSSDKITGNVACKGFAIGNAKIIFELSELEKIKKGDILVTPMTTPEMIPALKKISAIVTDEGGITCHAAIVSRELKIPCVIGTVNATEIIKDGDRLEVDANNGTVKIL